VNFHHPAGCKIPSSRSLVGHGHGVGEGHMPDTLVVAVFITALVLPVLTVIGGIIIALVVPRRR
jgi:hypothetical protein